MTRIFTAATLALMTVAGAASAMGNANFEVQQAVGGKAVLNTLSDRDVSRINSILHGGDSESEKRSAIKSVLLNAQG